MKNSVTRLTALLLVIATLFVLPVSASAATKVGKATIKSVDTYSTNDGLGLKYTWSKVSGAKGYEYRYNLFAGDEDAANNGTTRTTSKTTVKIGFQDYEDVAFQVRAYKTVKGKKVYGEWDSVKLTKKKLDVLMKEELATAASKLSKPSVKKPMLNLKQDSLALTFSWGKVSGAKGYEYRYNLFWTEDAREEDFTTGATTKRTATVGFQDSKTVLFQVRAYKESKGTRLYSKWASCAVNAAKTEKMLKEALEAEAIKVSKPKPKSVTIVRPDDARGLKFTWNKIPGATGYEYQYNLFYGAQNTYKADSVKTNSATVTFQDHGTILFKVRAYKNFNNKKVTGKWYTYKLTESKVRKMFG